MPKNLFNTAKKVLVVKALTKLVVFEVQHANITAKTFICFMLRLIRCLINNEPP